MAAYETYLNNWLIIKAALIFSWALILTAIHCVNEYEFCIHNLISCIYITFMTLICLDVQFTILTFIGYKKAILGTRRMEPYTRYTEMVSIIILFVATGALILSVPFYYICPYLQIGSWYVFSYATVHYTLLVIGLVWIAFNWLVARKILGYKQRQDYLIEKAGCVYISRRKADSSETTTPESVENDNDQGAATVVIIPTTSQ